MSWQLWDEPLPESEREAILESTADQIVKRGLQTPAIFALEMHKPLGWIAGQGMVFAAPLVAPLLGLDRMQNAARLLMEPGAIEMLIRRIEEKTEMPNRADQTINTTKETAA